MSDKYLTLLVVPHDERNVRRLRLGYRTLKVAAGIAAVLLVIVVAAVATYGRVASRAARATLLERQNARLVEENRKVEQIVENLARTEHAYDQIRAMAGLPPSTASSGESGVRESRQLPASEADTPLAAEAPVETTIRDRDPAPPASEPGAPSLWPLAIEGFVTAEFTGESAHPGLDIAVPPGTAVLATASGDVKRTGYDPVYGHFVVLGHGEDYESMYAHNETVLVATGDPVERGETIAYSGNSGRSTAPHLHYEVREEGSPVDPRAHLPR